MTTEHCRFIVDYYRKMFQTLNIPPIEHTRNRLPESDGDALAHCHWMLDRMDTILNEGDREKYMRWIGFIQGTLWMIGIATIDHSANLNRPEPF